MDRGWIKINRKIIDWEWYKDPNTLRVWLHCLLNANWEPSRYQGYEVPAGAFITGRKKLAKELGITEESVRIALTHLKATNSITIKTTNKFSIITIEKWADYQSIENETTNKTTSNTTNKQPTNNQQTTTVKEYKNIRNKEVSKYQLDRDGLPVNYVLENDIYAGQGMVDILSATDKFDTRVRQLHNTAYMKGIVD